MSAARQLLEASHHELSLVNTDEPDEHTIPSILAALTLAVQALAEDKTPPNTVWTLVIDDPDSRGLIRMAFPTEGDAYTALRVYVASYSPAIDPVAGTDGELVGWLARTQGIIVYIDEHEWAS